MKFYVEATAQLVGDDNEPLPAPDVELVADTMMEAFAEWENPGDIDVAANLARAEITLCGFYDAESPRDALDQADDLMTSVFAKFGGGRVQPTTMAARPAELISA